MKEDVRKSQIKRRYKQKLHLANNLFSYVLFVFIITSPSCCNAIQNQLSSGLSSRKQPSLSSTFSNQIISGKLQQLHIFTRTRGGHVNNDNASIIVSRHGATTANPTSGTPPLYLMRLLFLSFYGSLGVLMPYLPVYYDSLGHNGMSIGLLGAVKPITTFLVAPAWGILSDQTGAHSTILFLTFFIGLLLQLIVSMKDGINWLVITVFLAALFNAPVKGLMDNLVINTLPKNDKSEFGKMRLWGQIGFGLGSTCIGYYLSKTSGEGTAKGRSFFDKMLFTGFRPSFLAHGLLSIPVLICMRKFQQIERRMVITSNSKRKGKTNDHAKIVEGLQHLSRNRDAVIFFFLVFIIGTSSGCIENFAYVRMKEIGGTGKEMGISRFISSVAGAPMFWFSGSIIRSIGEENIMILSILSYVLRFFIYAYMKHPYHGLPAEALRGMTFGAFWSAGTTYAHKISPPGMTATMLMFFNAMYNGLGQSLGAIIGGKIQTKFGTVSTFEWGGISDLLFLVFITLYLKVWRKL